MAPRRRRVVWTVQARDALNEALEHIAEDSKSAAQDLLRECLQTASSLAEFSHRGLVVEEGSDSAVRQLIVQRYRMLYQVTATEVQILALIHGSRDFTAWRRKDGFDSPAG